MKRESWRDAWHSLLDAIGLAIAAFVATVNDLFEDSAKTNKKL